MRSAAILAASTHKESEHMPPGRRRYASLLFVTPGPTVLTSWTWLAEETQGDEGAAKQGQMELVRSAAGPAARLGADGLDGVDGGKHHAGIVHVRGGSPGP